MKQLFFIINIIIFTGCASVYRDMQKRCLITPIEYKGLTNTTFLGNIEPAKNDTIMSKRELYKYKNSLQIDILFYKIDDTVQVFLNNKLVYDNPFYCDNETHISYGNVGKIEIHTENNSKNVDLVLTNKRKSFCYHFNMPYEKLNLVFEQNKEGQWSYKNVEEYVSTTRLLGDSTTIKYLIKRKYWKFLRNCP